MTPEEIAQWKSYLNTARLTLKNINDPFDLVNYGEDGWTEDLHVTTWKWTDWRGKKSYALKELYSSPGDANTGAIFIENDTTPVILISDDEFQDATFKPDKIKQMLLDEQESLEELRRMIHEYTSNKHIMKQIENYMINFKQRDQGRIDRMRS